MSFINKSRNLTILLLILIPTCAFMSWLITTSIMNTRTEYILNIDGSSTVFKIIDSAQYEFMDSHPGVSVTTSGVGTGAGITALTDGVAHVAMASRPVKEIENESANYRLKSYAIAKDGLAIILHASASTLNITLDEARAIFNGTVATWADPLVAGTGLSGEIQLVVREEGSGTRDAFNELVMGDDKQLEPGSEYAVGALPKSSNQLIKDAVAANPNYIGYVGLGYMDESVDAVLINGVLPSKETVQNSTYEIQRELYLVTMDDPTGLAKEFIIWMFDPVGQDVVIETGFINVTQTSDEE